jgi:hypothetical protein
MAYTEKLLPVEALLGMWQQRRAQETDNSNSMTPIQEAMAKEQLKSMQEKNKMAELTRGLLTPGAKNPVMDSPYTQGFPAYQQEQDRIKNAALATGQSLPNQGFSGGGYGGGGESQPIPAQESGMTYTGPDHSQNSTVDIANALGALYNRETPPQEITGALGDEQQNVSGLQSLINQSGGKIPQEMMGGTAPVQRAVNMATDRETADKLIAAKGDVLKIKKDEATSRIKSRQNEADEIKKYSAEIYKSDYWKGSKDGSIKPMLEGIKKEILQVLPGFIAAARNRGLAPDIQTLINGIVEKYNK